jgi:hypothetical protein
VSTATITIKDSTGQNVYTGTVAVNPGTQSFTWNGRGNDGRLWPDGAYTLTATPVDTNKQSVAISEVQAIVDSVDLTQEPPSCRSMDRTTRSTRSSGLSGRPHDRGMGKVRGAGLQLLPAVNALRLVGRKVPSRVDL